MSGRSHGQRSLVGYSSQGRKRVRLDLVTKQQQEKENGIEKKMNKKLEHMGHRKEI